jgi:tRNA threonylcarbamoyl adenosine modification protein YeaZ
MRILGINTATEITEIALINGQDTLYKQEWKANYDEAEKLLPAIAEAIDALKQEKLDKIFVVKGPAGFTSLRIGVTAANTLGLVTGAALAALDTFDFIKERLPEIKGKIAILTRAGGENVAIKTSFTQKELLQIPLKELSSFFKDNKITHYISAIVAAGAAPPAANFSLKNLLPFDEFLKKDLIFSLPVHKIIKPFYLNPPQITESKKKSFAKKG